MWHILHLKPHRDKVLLLLCSYRVRAIIRPLAVDFPECPPCPPPLPHTDSSLSLSFIHTLTFTHSLSPQPESVCGLLQTLGGLVSRHLCYQAPPRWVERPAAPSPHAPRRLYQLSPHSWRQWEGTDGGRGGHYWGRTQWSSPPIKFTHQNSSRPLIKQYEEALQCAEEKSPPPQELYFL